MWPKNIVNDERLPSVHPQYINHAQIIIISRNLMIPMVGKSDPAIYLSISMCFLSDRDNFCSPSMTGRYQLSGRYWDDMKDRGIPTHVMESNHGNEQPQVQSMEDVEKVWIYS